MIIPNNIAEAADDLDRRIQDSQTVQQWCKVSPKESIFTEPYFISTVDPMNVVYKTKTLEIAIGIYSQSGEARVVISWPFNKWRNGISDIELNDTLEKAIKLLEFLNTNMILQTEGAYPNVNITMEAL
jgi:hypothetical protein